MPSGGTFALEKGEAFAKLTVIQSNAGNMMK